jgi:hypothetical protein
MISLHCSREPARGREAFARFTEAASRLAATVALSVGSVFAEEQSLFNGKDLTGWEGATNVWRVQDGVIVGGHLEGNPRNEFLATTRDYRDFVLRFEYKIVAPESYNSGVQFRSERITRPPNEMKGFQADIGPGITGALYDESRRNRFVAAAKVKDAEKRGEWNRYEVRCEGARIQLFVNGKQTVDYTETDSAIPQTGKIALQVHGNAKQECHFRNITIEEPKSEK